MTVPKTFADKSISVGLGDLDTNFTYLEQRLDNVVTSNVTSNSNVSTGNVIAGNVFVSVNVSTGNIVAGNVFVTTNLISGNVYTNDSNTVNVVIRDLSTTGLDLTTTAWSGSPSTVSTNGTIQFNKNSLYATVDRTQGVGYVPATQFRYLTSNTIFGVGGFISTAELPFMGNSNGVMLTANSAYEIEWQLYFQKITAGTVTFNIRFRSGSGAGSGVNPQLVNATYVGGAASVVAAACTAGRIIGTADPFTLPVTPSLADNTLYAFNIKAFVITNSVTSGNCYLSVSTSAGRITPNTGSYMKVTKLPRSNVGVFS